MNCKHSVGELVGNDLVALPLEMANKLKDAYKREEVTLKMLQDQLPWGANEYNEVFQNSPALHKDFQHALVHVLKALGKLSSFAEAADHAEGANFPYDEISKYLADIVICTVRMANTKPNARVDLSKAVLDRIEQKMGVRLPVTTEDTE